MQVLLDLFYKPRLILLGIFVVTTGLLATAFYMEYVMLLDPCPLCMMQRIWVGIAGVLALAGAIHGRGLMIWGGTVIGACLIGSGFSLRQLWLQSLPPDQVPACGPSLGYMLEVFPFSEVLEAMVFGTGNCAEVSWTFLGLSIPAWVLVAFVAIIAATVLALRAPRTAATA